MSERGKKLKQIYQQVQSFTHKRNVSDSVGGDRSTRGVRYCDGGKGVESNRTSPSPTHETRTLEVQRTVETELVT